MRPEPLAAFVFDLLQDVNILRPLVRLVAHRFGRPIALVVSNHFTRRDDAGLWRSELDTLAVETGAIVVMFSTTEEAVRALQRRRGILVAGGETDLPAHGPVHALFRAAPPGFLRITLQHGYECPGFLQTREHDRAFGRDVGFAADVICGWSEGDVLASIAARQRSKLLVTGPTAVLNAPRNPGPRSATGGGLVCENLHSVRLAGGTKRASYMETFTAFCAALNEQGESVTLRPHPGGQYVLKKDVALPPNVSLENRPIYAVDLRSFAYGISAPSSILVDMVLSDIPTAVWTDDGGRMDARSYESLSCVGGLRDWLAFRRDAALRPEMLLARNKRFLQDSGIVTDPEEVERRFTRLFAAGLEARAAEPRAMLAGPPSPVARAAGARSA